MRKWNIVKVGNAYITTDYRVHGGVQTRKEIETRSKEDEKGNKWETGTRYNSDVGYIIVIC